MTLVKVDSGLKFFDILKGSKVSLNVFNNSHLILDDGIINKVGEDYFLIEVESDFHFNDKYLLMHYIHGYSTIDETFVINESKSYYITVYNDKSEVYLNINKGRQIDPIKDKFLYDELKKRK